MDDEEITVDDKDELKDVVVVDSDDFGGIEIEDVDTLEPEDSASPPPLAPPVDNELTLARQEIANLRQQAQQNIPQQYQAPTTNDGIDDATKDIFKQRTALAMEYEQLSRIDGALTPEKIESMQQQSQVLEMKLMRSAAQSTIQQNAPNLAQQAQREHYRRMYGDVHANQNANNWAQAQHAMLVAEGAPLNDATIEKAMNQARVKFGMVNRKPTEQDRAQLMGTSGGGGRQRRAPSNTVKFDKPSSIMANEMFLDATNGDTKKAKQLFAAKIIIPARRRAAELAKRRG